jgi:hypothetical protein
MKRACKWLAAPALVALALGVLGTSEAKADSGTSFGLYIGNGGGYSDYGYGGYGPTYGPPVVRRSYYYPGYLPPTVGWSAYYGNFGPPAVVLPPVGYRHLPPVYRGYYPRRLHRW